MPAMRIDMFERSGLWRRIAVHWIWQLVLILIGLIWMIHFRLSEFRDPGESIAGEWSWTLKPR